MSLLGMLMSLIMRILQALHDKFEDSKSFRNSDKFHDSE